MPSPSLPVVPSKWKEETPALPKSTVVEAERPLVKSAREVVAAATTPKLFSQVNGLAAPKAVWSVPQERLPLVSALTSQEADVRVETCRPPVATVSPPEMVDVETELSVSTPVLSILKRLVVPVCVEDAITNMVVILPVELLGVATESRANGDVVPIPISPEDFIYRFVLVVERSSSE